MPPHIDWPQTFTSAGGVIALFILALGGIGNLRDNRRKDKQKADAEVDEQGDRIRTMQEREIELLKEELARVKEEVSGLKSRLTTMQEQYTTQLTAEKAEVSRLLGENTELRDGRLRDAAHAANLDLQLESLRKEIASLRRRAIRSTDPAESEGERSGTAEDRL